MATITLWTADTETSHASYVDPLSHGIRSQSLPHGTRSCLALMVLGRWYNDHNGSESWVTRNFINAAGYLSFIYGALEVAIDSQAHLSEKAYQWFLMIGIIIFSTIQAQDIPDQAGDSARGRKTLPLVIGDMPARWSMALLLPIWSLLASAFWQLDAAVYFLPLTLSGLIAKRLLRYRDVANDELTFMMWNAWILTIYALPIMKKVRN